MTIVYWILLVLSGLILFLIFARRLRLTVQDVKLQTVVQEEMAPPEPEIPVEEDSLHVKEGQTARQLFSQAEEQFKKKNLEEAERLLLQAVEADEAHQEAHLKLGTIYMDVEAYPKAELHFSKLVNLKKDPVYYSNLGAALYHQQRLVEAAEAYENAVTLDSRRANRILSLAQIYYELGDDERALKYFEMAVKRKPKDHDLKILLADHFERVHLYQNAIEVLNRLLEGDPYNEAIKARVKELQTKQDQMPSA